VKVGSVVGSSSRRVCWFTVFSSAVSGVDKNCGTSQSRSNAPKVTTPCNQAFMQQKVNKHAQTHKQALWL
jgi:hypothetical protein